jgi:hypothetical protein
MSSNSSSLEHTLPPTHADNKTPTTMTINMSVTTLVNESATPTMSTLRFSTPLALPRTNSLRRLPKRPLPPAQGSTLHSPNFGSNGGVGSRLPSIGQCSVSGMTINNGRPCFSQDGELVLGHMPSSPPATGAVRLGDTSDDGSEGALSNPEIHTFGLPVVAGAGSLLARRAGCMRIRLRVIRDGHRFLFHRRRPPPPRLRLLRLP